MHKKPPAFVTDGAMFSFCNLSKAQETTPHRLGLIPAPTIVFQFRKLPCARLGYANSRRNDTEITANILHKITLSTMKNISPCTK